MSASIEDLHNAIEQGFSEQFVGRVRTVRSYWPTSTDPANPPQIETPAIIIEIDRAELGDDRGDERTPVRLYFNAFCVLSIETQQLPLRLREFAAEALSIVRYNRWGLGQDVGRPDELEFVEAEFDPGQNGYDSICVTWQQTIYLGGTIFQGTIPRIVKLGFAPDIGAAHEADYEEITNEI